MGDSDCFVAHIYLNGTFLVEVVTYVILRFDYICIISVNECLELYVLKICFLSN